MNKCIFPPLLSRGSLLLCVCAGVLAGHSAQVPAKETQDTLTDENRIAIIRGVSAEYARARIVLPRGQKPVELNSRGEYNETAVKGLVMKYGPAVETGQELQITRIEFRPKEIFFEINGGGKRKRHWSEHVQIGIGVGGPPRSVSQPGPAPGPTGSSLLLRFDGPVPNLTAVEVKQLLSRVLNFNPQSAAANYVDSLPPEFKEAVGKHEARVGMDRDMVIAALGRPDRKIREKNNEGVDQEQWIYGSPPGKVLFIVFEEDKVVSIKEY